MGYCMSQDESQFHIKASDKDLALRAIKTLMGNKRGSFNWVDASTVKSSRNLTDAMREWRWDVEEDEAGDIVGITFAGEKAGDDLTLFKTIAPFVKSGSYIEMHGEDGTRWRWIFSEKTCVEKTAKVSWD
jgi:hypothetical protein